MSNEEFEREERAFAEALHASVPVESFRPLDPEAIRAAAGPVTSTRRRTWFKGIAAAAAVVVAVGAGAVLVPRLLGSSGSVTAAPASSDGFAAGGSAATPEPGQFEKSNDTSVGGTSVTGQAGFRWESYRDVMVQVPDSWAYASAPQTDHCTARELPSEPYVDLNRGGAPVAAILCPDLRDDQQAMHLSFTPADGGAPWLPQSQVWKQYSRVLGQARITVTALAGDAGIADQILESAAIVPAGTNPDGCPVTMPTVPAVELADLDAGPLAVCLYERDRQRGALRSSVALDGPDASAVWQAILAAPEGGGPNMSATTCGEAKGWPLLLLVGTEHVPVAASIAGCEGNGVADAAARDGARVITRRLCQGLLRDPVRIFEGYGPSAGLCMR